MGIGRQYESDPEAAIRKGDFFSCVRCMGEPERFEFFAYRGLQKFPSGSDSPANSNLHVEAQAGKQPTRLVSKKDGATTREIVGDHLDLENAPVQACYHVDVFLVAHPLLQANVPWILSNPIFVGVTRGPRPAQTSTTIRAQLAKCSDFWKRQDFY